MASEAMATIWCAPKRGTHAGFLRAVLEHTIDTGSKIAKYPFPKVTVQKARALHMTVEQAEKLVAKMSTFPIDVESYIPAMARFKYEIRPDAVLEKRPMGRPPLPLNRCRHCMSHIFREDNVLKFRCCFCNEIGLAPPTHGVEVLDLDLIRAEALKDAVKKTPRRSTR